MTAAEVSASEMTTAESATHVAAAEAPPMSSAPSVSAPSAAVRQRSGESRKAHQKDCRKRRSQRAQTGFHGIPRIQNQSQPIGPIIPLRRNCRTLSFRIVMQAGPKNTCKFARERQSGQRRSVCRSPLRASTSLPQGTTEFRLQTGRIPRGRVRFSAWEGRPPRAKQGGADSRARSGRTLLAVLRRDPTAIPAWPSRRSRWGPPPVWRHRSGYH
jgi:hypothetical protein